MSVYVQDADLVLHHGDALEVLRGMADGSVNCCICSPPYWSLRDYGVEGQLGLEPTPEQYVAAMVTVFREVRRVLADDGTLWLNLGDSYASSPSGQNGTSESLQAWGGGAHKPAERFGAAARRPVAAGLKPKDLVGIPWRVAFALQQDGWYLRSDIIWAKKNCMPESVTDRPTKSHEYVFLLSKSARYWFDQEAVREPAEWQRWGDQTNGKHEGAGGSAGWIGAKSKDELQRRAYRPGRENAIEAYPGAPQSYSDGRAGFPTPDRGRNIRSVWEIATQPYAEAHFATYPEELVRRCLLAGCPAEVCGTCGTPVESSHAVPVQSVPPAVRGMAVPGGDNEVLQQEVPGTIHAVDTGRLRGMRRDVPEGHGRESVLWPDVLESSDGTDQEHDQGLRPDGKGLHSPSPAWTSDVDEDGVRLGASVGDGGVAWADAVADRSRGPCELDQGRQSDREPAAHDEEGARRDVQPGTGADGSLSELRDALPSSRACRQCGADLTAPGSARPGVVLDCFAGSGTTALVARRHGRRSVLIELSADYCALAARRLQQLSLLAEPA